MRNAAKAAHVAGAFSTTIFIQNRKGTRMSLAALLLIILLEPSAMWGQVEHPADARRQMDSLITLSRSLTGKKDFGEAIRVIEAAENLAVGALGSGSAEYARCLHNHGRTLQVMGRLPEAEPFYLQAKAIWKLLPPGDPDYERNLNNLGVLYNGLERFDEAEEQLQEVVSIRKNGNPAGYATSLANLGNTYTLGGRYEAATRCYAQAADIRATHLGKRFDYAKARNGQAVALQGAGQYELAEPVYREALAIIKDTLGESHPEYLPYLGNLAQLYADMGRYEEAGAMMKEIIDVLGQEHPQYGDNANNLARVYFYQKRYQEAETLFRNAMAAREKRYTKNHAMYAQSLDNLAGLYMTTHRFTEAASLFEEAMAIREAKLGKEHPDYAANLNNLGILYYTLGNYSAAEAAYLEAKAIKERTLGTKHPSYALAVRNLALLYQAWNKPELAAGYFLEANQLHLSLIETSALAAGENGMLAYLAMYERFFDEIQSFAGDNPDVRLHQVLYDDALFMKDFLLEKNRHLNRVIAAADSLTRQTYERWLAGRRRLAEEYAKPVAERRRIAVLEQQTEQLEKTLTRSVDVFTKLREIPGWRDVQARLGQKEAAIEFVHYHYYLPQATDSILYAALLLLPGESAPRFIPLCEERQIIALMPAASGPAHTGIENIYALLHSDGKTPLYRLIWAPLDQILAEKGIKTVHYAPSGVIHRLSLNALSRDKTGEMLADRYDLVRHGTTRELLNRRNKQAYKIGAAAIFGGVYYDPKKPHTGVTGAATLATPDALKMGYLPSTAELATWLHGHLQRRGISSSLYLGHTATEPAFKAIETAAPSPNLLHIGTHGYFYPAPPQTSTFHSAGPDTKMPAFQISGHPLIRSGILLAGAKNFWNDQRPLPGIDDGILTAFEAGQMDLSHTDLVVLSACETGLGDIKGNEGVYGLQRAFRIAGARNVLASLWEVGEEATKELFESFYLHLLNEELTVQEALHRAQNDLRKQEQFSSPYFWAGFVVVGE